MAVPAKKRHVMPDAEDEEVFLPTVTKPAPIDVPAEAPEEEADPTAVSDAMAELYPEAAQEAEEAEESMYTRRRRTTNDE